MSATSEATEGAGAPGGARQFVTFRVGPELFGVPLAEVQEIIRMPDLVQVPLAPASLEGVANLRGAILPITSLRRVFGVEELAHDDATRVVVVRLQDRPAGFVVDRMASVVTAEPDEIEDADAVGGEAQGELLRGVVKRTDGMIQLLEPARLVGQMPAAAARAEASRQHRPEDAGPAEVPQDDIQLVSFVAAGQEYAFPIEEVQEIVQLPPEVTRVPQAPPAVIGVITLRERLLPLVSLRGLFGLPADALGESSRIVVVAPDGGTDGHVGLVVDQVREVLRVPRALADPVPPLLADGAEGRLQAICRLDQGRRLAAILSARRLFRDAGLRAAIEAAGAAMTEDTMPAQDAKTMAAAEDEQFVVFRLAGEEYGVPTEAVQEIVRVPEDLTRIPRTPDFIEGVVNLRGTVLPVVDQRRRFGLPSHERNDRQRIMVLQIAGGRTGFIVDQVTEVLKLPRGAIEAAPELSREQARLIRRVANLEAQKRMVLLLDPAQLLDAGEIDALAAV
jgi:purine-binding chemotaxis protein CheW